MGNAAAGSCLAVASFSPDWGGKRRSVAALREDERIKEHDHEKARRGMIALSCSIMCVTE
jgi:hypothetical protein